MTLCAWYGKHKIQGKSLKTVEGTVHISVLKMKMRLGDKRNKVLCIYYGGKPKVFGSVCSQAVVIVLC